MSNTQIKDGDIVYDPQFKEIFICSPDRDRMILNRLTLATDEQKLKLKESGKECIAAE